MTLPLAPIHPAPPARVIAVWFDETNVTAHFYADNGRGYSLSALSLREALTYPFNYANSRAIYEVDHPPTPEELAAINAMYHSGS